MYPFTFYSFWELLLHAWLCARAEKAQMNRRWSFLWCSDIPRWTSTSEKIKTFGSVVRTLPPPGNATPLSSWRNCISQTAWPWPYISRLGPCQHLKPREKAQCRGELLLHPGTARTSNSPRQGQNKKSFLRSSTCWSLAKKQLLNEGINEWVRKK